MFVCKTKISKTISTQCPRFCKCKARTVVLHGTFSFSYAIFGNCTLSSYNSELLRLLIIKFGKDGHGHVETQDISDTVILP